MLTKYFTIVLCTSWWEEKVTNNTVIIPSLDETKHLPEWRSGEMMGKYACERSACVKHGPTFVTVVRMLISLVTRPTDRKRTGRSQLRKNFTSTLSLLANGGVIVSLYRLPSWRHSHNSCSTTQFVTQKRLNQLTSTDTEFTVKNILISALRQCYTNFSIT